MTKTSAFAHLLAAVEKETSGKKDYTDDTFYKLEPDAAGNAAAVIRFLPSRDPELLPFVKYFSYSFQNPRNKRWFIENCPSSIGKDSYVMDFNSHLWNEVGTEEAKNQARRQKRTLSYVANILVINDPKHPEKNGNVYKWRFGKKIFDKIAEKVQGNELDQPVNVFDLVEGCNFKLRMKKIAVSGSKPMPNYDSSEWDSTSAIVKSEAEADALLAKTHDLQYLLDPKNYKSYEELKKKLEWVLGATQQQESSAAEFDAPDTVAQQETSFQTSGVPEKFDEDIPVATQERKPILNLSNDDDDDDEDYFKKLAAM